MVDERTWRRRAIRNRAQAALLLAGMLGTAVVLAALLFGPAGVVWTLVLGGTAAALQPSVPPNWLLSRSGARPLPAAAAPQLHQLVAGLAASAGLCAVPDLYHVRSPVMNAFAVAGTERSAIVLTDGLLRRLTPSELAGVLAHEISHVRAGDLRIMNLSDTVARLSHSLAYVGLALLVLFAPAAGEAAGSPMAVALVLTAVPTLVSLLQLALSRSREYDADLQAATLTGDPVSLASALTELERSAGPLWERTMLSHRRAPDPLLLRTHPPTHERVRRLLELRPSWQVPTSP